MPEESSEAAAEIERLRSREAGETDTDVYEDIDVSVLPSWWRRAIREFEEHGLRPYRPPQFADGTLKHRVINQLEERYDVSLRLVGTNVSHGADWEVHLDGEPIGTIGRHRSHHGYTVYEMESDEFTSWILDAVETADE